MIDFRSGREPKSSSFDYISIRIASPEEIRGPARSQGARAPGAAGAAHLVVVGRGDQARDHQLPLVQAGEGRPLLRAHLRSGQGLGVPLRQVQADPLSRRDLRPLRRRGHAVARCAASAWATSSSACRWRTSGSSRRCPSPMGNLLDITLRDLERVIYYSNYVVIEPGKQEVEANQLLDEDEYLDPPRQGAGGGRHRVPGRHRRAGGARAARAGSTSTSWPTSCAPAWRPRRSQHRKKQMLKRLKIVDAFRNSGDSGDAAQQPGLDDPGRDPGDPARPAAAGAARRRALRHVRPERPVSPGDQPEQPARRS